MSSFLKGESMQLTIFGESHGKALGGVCEGLPIGAKVDLEALEVFMARRAPGSNKFVTSRREGDEVEFLSGLRQNTIEAGPLSFIIKNKDQKSSAYADLTDVPRPGHADLSARIKYQRHVDLSGGGHFSGRLTAPLCVIGGLCLQWLEAKGIKVRAHLLETRGFQDVSATEFSEVPQLEPGKLPILDQKRSQELEDLLMGARSQGDSLGGIVEVTVAGLPAGLGEPMFDGLENLLARAFFAIPGLKGIEFGSGFKGALALGSENNDEILGLDHFATNHSGGILGGISNGDRLHFKLAFKPTPSIAKVQQSIHLTSKERVSLTIQGRHDPCFALRAVPVTEAVTAIVLLDLLLTGRGRKWITD